MKSTPCKFSIHFLISCKCKLDVENTKAMYNLYVETTHVVDWYYRLHVRNKTVIDNFSEYTGIDLSYDMNSGDNLRGDPDTLDVSDFKFHINR